MKRFCAIAFLFLLLVPSTLFGQVPSTQTMQVAQTTGNGTAILLSGQEGPFVIAVEWSVGTTAGVITIEEALTAAYAGTWSSIATASWATATTVEVVHLAVGQYAAVRARISTTVEDGTVTVSLVGR